MSSGSKPLAHISEEVSVTAAQLLSEILGGLLRLFEVTIDLFSVVQIVGYGRIDLGKR